MNLRTRQLQMKNCVGFTAALFFFSAGLLSAAQLRTPSVTRLAIDGARFTVNGKPAFLYGISYYGALGASEEFMREDLADMQRYGLNWIRVWANWAAFSNNVSVVDEEGRARPPFLSKLQWLVGECDRRGMLVDVTLSRGDGSAGSPRLQTLEAHRRAVEVIVEALKAYGNWYLDLSNERNIRDKRFTSLDDLKNLRELVRKLDPTRLVTASDGGDISKEDLSAYLQVARVDFISPHRPREPASPAQTEAKSRQYLAWMEEIHHIAPLHYQEPFRRGYGKWEPKADDFITDTRGAKAAGAAGWCFHNGSERNGGQPRRSFDLSQRRLFVQLDREEMMALDKLRTIFRDGSD